MGRDFKRIVWEWFYTGTVLLLYPLNFVLSLVRRKKVFANSVIHISYMVHVPYHTVNILRRLGMKADYLAIGSSPLWDKCDYHLRSSRLPWMQPIREFLMLWRVVAKYEVVHLHFMITMSRSGWELPLLKNMGRKIVIHYRGCEIRDRKINMALHPDVNICQECDYNARICTSPTNLRRRILSRKFGDLFLVTTRDMKDFVPEAEYMAFFAPEVGVGDLGNGSRKVGDGKEEIKIVHVTVHPGIEGTRYVQEAIENLKARGYRINFVYLNMVPHERVLEELKDADLAVGKMKMGDYANSQIEAMALGVPSVTYVRTEFIDDELKNSGFILCSIKDLEQTLEHYIKHPEELERKKRIARQSILRIHDNDRLGKRLIELYNKIKM